MQTISRYLETLRGTVDGDELHGIIARTLRRHSRNGPPGPDCLLDLYEQLDAYARDAVALPRMRIRARLLQQHITPYLTDLKRARLAEGRRHDATAAAPPAATQAAQAGTADAESEAARVLEGVVERPREQQAQAAAERAARYNELLRSEKDAWQAIYGTVKDYQRLKQAWMKSLDELAQQRDALEQKLRRTTEKLSRLEVEHERLRTALAQARTDAKRARPSALPRRDAFARQLQAEIRRTRRSGAPLALGLIRIEGLDGITERYGAEAADAALRCYAQEILSNFRAYDIVAHYDSDQFAVMFPDTAKEGARRALEKAYKRAAETHINHAGASIPLPPFVGALVTYSPGEDPAVLLKRAERALADARARGERGVIQS
ncbi:MAG TPA: GGDEF domain-containing protein [Burkholderiales bacterium]